MAKKVKCEWCGDKNADKFSWTCIACGWQRNFVLCDDCLDNPNLLCACFKNTHIFEHPLTKEIFRYS